MDDKDLLHMHVCVHARVRGQNQLIIVCYISFLLFISKLNSFHLSVVSNCVFHSNWFIFLKQ
jgi:hypothetical protein